MLNAMSVVLRGGLRRCRQLLPLVGCLGCHSDFGGRSLPLLQRGGDGAGFARGRGGLVVGPGVLVRKTSETASGVSSFPLFLLINSFVPSHSPFIRC